MVSQSQKRLAELLKKKGIGPAGSKSLKEEELEEVLDLFQDDSVSLTTKATMLTALLLLEPTEIESVYIEKIKAEPTNYLQTELQEFLNETSDPLLKLIQKNIEKVNRCSKKALVEFLIYQLDYVSEINYGFNVQISFSSSGFG